MKRLLLVSNRLPVTIERRKTAIHYRPSVGGLATGLKSFNEKHNSIWIGWCGASSNQVDSNSRIEIESELLEKYKSVPTFFSRKDIRLFYTGFCNRTIWPLFHYFSNYANYDQQTWQAYQRVNRQFSQAVLKIARPDDIIWIHDYHLFLLPRMLREQLPQSHIGFFLHIPFPSYEIFRLMPWREEILNGVLGADLIGFHTYDYVRHFNSSIQRVLGYEHIFGQVVVNNRIVKIDAFPMGIDFAKFADAKPKSEWLQELHGQCNIRGGCRIILSIDRMDYTKGIPNRLEAFDHFLDKYPQYKGYVTLIMVAVPSRTSVDTYVRLKQHVDELVGRINGKHGAMGWMPVWYYYRYFGLEDLVSMYNMADVALVTPLRDGMNLIAKEYLAARKDDLGALILSEMAGARSELAEAIIVNPNNKEEIADAIDKALNLSDEEQIERNRIMKARLERYNIDTWAEDFMARLAKVKSRQNEINTKKLTQANRRQMIRDFIQCENRLFLLDYDGTLVSFRGKPEQAKPDNEILTILQALMKHPKNEVVIVSGRDRNTLDEWFGDLNVGLSAEHGVWIKTDRRNWQIAESMQDEWKTEIRSVVETYVDRTPASFIEEKSYSLVWHYRNVNPELAAERTRELKDDLLHLTSNLNLMVLDGNKVIEIKGGGVHKGRTALHWTSEREWDFILAIGDDWTDEDLFEVLPETAYTIKVGVKMTKARFYLTGVQEVREMLKSLTEI